LTGPRGVFVTGTDTGVGKTYVGAAVIRALVARGIRVIPRKPVESGCELPDGKLVPADATRLYAAAGRPGTLNEVCAYRLRESISPARAAQLQDLLLTIADLERAVLNGVDGDSLVWVEGAGGFYSPLASDGLNADLAQRLSLPVLLVAADRLGSINHILLTTEAIRARGLNLIAVVLNQISPDITPAMDNADDLRRWLDCPVFRLDLCEMGDPAHPHIAPLAGLVTDLLTE
jgi:dethiobiotin synthetase